MPPSAILKFDLEPLKLNTGSDFDLGEVSSPRQPDAFMIVSLNPSSALRSARFSAVNRGRHLSCPGPISVSNRTMS